MKKLSFILCIFILAHVSCRTVAVGESGTVNLQKQNQTEMTNDLTVTILSMERSFRKYEGMKIELKNIGNNPVVINWNKSSISYNETVSNLLITGQKYIKAGTADVPPLTIPAGSKKKIYLCPSDNVEWKGDEWEVRGVQLKKGSEVKLSISASIGENEKIISVKMPVE